MVRPVKEVATAIEGISGVAGVHHIHLWSMQERVDQLGGQFEIQSVPGRGTTLRVVIPRRDSTSETSPRGTPGGEDKGNGVNDPPDAGYSNFIFGANDGQD